MVGVDNTIYLIDFGLAQHFNPNHNHIPLTTGNDLIGTIRYTSINSHMGLQHSRRDDLESLAYTLVYLLYGRLPWQGIRISRKKDLGGVVLQRKLEFCKRNGDVIPRPITSFLHHTRSLAFNERPDYIHLHSLLQELAT